VTSRFDLVLYGSLLWRNSFVEKFNLHAIRRWTVARQSSSGVHVI
jgi:hypothetical protein